MVSLSPLVLCVDDDAEDLMVITSIIQELEPSFATSVARDGEEALTYLQRAKEFKALPDLILLDMNMPRMNGRQTLAHIKADLELRSVPLVVFTTSSHSPDRLYCAGFGVEMVTKPDTLSQMRAVLQRLLVAAVPGMGKAVPQ